MVDTGDHGADDEETLGDHHVLRVTPGSSDQRLPGLVAMRAKVLGSLFPKVAAPERFGRYVVLDTLGKGGMGTVLRAFDLELDRPVAIKVLHGHLGKKHTTRLKREAQAMAKLSHPNVVQVYEVAEVDGQTFVAMELVKGRTPTQWAEQEPRPDWRACVRLFLQLGEGLAVAHSRGLIHRDFKPGNAIVDDEGRARVLDFGLARQDDEETRELSIRIKRAKTDRQQTVPPDLSLTKTGAVLGTPGYMPLEQMYGQEADARSDQFSFCVSLYEALYGERPYEGGTLMALMAAMQAGMVRPAPKGTTVPAALRKVLLRGLAVDPAERWPSMHELLFELERLVLPRRWRGIAGAGVAVAAIAGVVAIQQSAVIHAQEEQLTVKEARLQRQLADLQREKLRAEQTAWVANYRLYSQIWLASQGHGETGRT